MYAYMHTYIHTLCKEERTAIHGQKMLVEVDAETTHKVLAKCVEQRLVEPGATLSALCAQDLVCTSEAELHNLAEQLTARGVAARIPGKGVALFMASGEGDDIFRMPRLVGARIHTRESQDPSHYGRYVRGGAGQYALSRLPHLVQAMRVALRESGTPQPPPRAIFIAPFAHSAPHCCTLHTSPPQPVPHLPPPPSLLPFVCTHVPHTR